MLKRNITYTNFDGNTVTETFYFNLTQSELIEMEVGGDSKSYSDAIRRIIDEKDQGKILFEFKKLILKAYGVKSEDGSRFVKSAELSEAFSQTAAYDALFMEIATNEKVAAEFVNGIMPSNLFTQDKPTLPPPSPASVGPTT